MKTIFQWAIVAILSIYSTNMLAAGTTINYRLATADETRKLLQNNTDYYAKMNQMDIDWRVRKTGGTLAELQTMAWQQTRPRVVPLRNAPLASIPPENVCPDRLYGDGSRHHVPRCHHAAHGHQPRCRTPRQLCRVYHQRPEAPLRADTTLR